MNQPTLEAAGQPAQAPARRRADRTFKIAGNPDFIRFFTELSLCNTPAKSALISPPRPFLH
jgi:hypothetical protein